MMDMPFNSWDEFFNWMAESALFTASWHIAVIFAGAVLLRWLVHRSIAQVENSAVQKSKNRPSRIDKVLTPGVADLERRSQRALTLGSLLRSTSTFAIGVVAALMVMAEVGLPLGPLLASAGVGGVALGFGAQSLVKDFLSGVFMIIEDQYGVGDVIDTGEAIGTVEEVGLRITRLRDASGIVWFVRNGEILRIGNKSEGWSLASVDVAVDYDEDPGKVTDLLNQVCDEMFDSADWQEKLVERPAVVGVQSVSGGSMTLRIHAKCIPGEQYGATREIQGRAKRLFDASGIKGPRVNPAATPPAS